MLPVLALLLATPAPSSAVAQARELSWRSRVESNAGAFDRALADATRAYALDPLPERLYAVGQCHEALGHWAKAVAFYRDCLRARPASRRAASALARVEALQRRSLGRAQNQPLTPPGPQAIARAPPLPASPTLLFEAAAEPPHTNHLGRTLGGVALLAAGGGAAWLAVFGFAGEGIARRDQAAAPTPLRGAYDANVRWLSGVGLTGVVGALLFAGGGAALLVTGGGGTALPARVSLAPIPGGAAVSLAGAFGGVGR